jgi:hypothetical protein
MESPISVMSISRRQRLFSPTKRHSSFHAIIRRRIRFVRIPAGVRVVGWHTPPGRVLAVWLDGVVEFEVSDGEMRRVSVGGSVLVEDTRGKGHISRHPIEGHNGILISLPNGLDPPLE